MDSKAYFEQVASHWDQMRTSFFPTEVREKALDRASVQAGQTALDLGAGTGFVSQALLERGLKVIAVDQSPEMLKVLKQKYPTVDCRQGEARRLPVKDATVDYVFANMYLHHVSEPAPAIREMARVLKPGGWVVITDLDEHDFEFLRSEQHDYWLGFKRTDLAVWFEQAGLERVTVDCVGEECCAESTCGCSQAKISIFLGMGQKPAQD